MDFNKKLGLPEELGIGDLLVEDQQNIRIYIEKRKWGKNVTIIEGFDKEINLKILLKKLKSKVASGGTAKNGRIELQGDHSHTVKDHLINSGFDEGKIEIVAKMKRR